MRRLFTTLAALVLVLATALPVGAANPDRPFKGSWVSPDGFDFAAPACPTGTFLRFSTTGYGQFAHLGKTGVAMTHCTTFDATLPGGTFEQGTITLTAANGDTLTLGERGTYRMWIPNPTPPPPFEVATSKMTWWVTGGTGRFVHAKGSGSGVALDNMMVGIQGFELWGTVAY